jgi:hypothetical protein
MLTAELETEQAPIDAYAVALVETDHYFIDKADAPFIKAIRGMYLFDRNERVHCCEMTPSFYLIHLYDQVECQPGTSEDRAQAIYDKYEQHGGEPKYVHCYQIENMIGETDTPSCCHLGRAVTRATKQPIPYDVESHDEQMESMRQGYSENPPL